MTYLPRRASLLAVVLSLIATALVYAPGLSGDFVFDDFPNIVGNPSVHMERLDAESLSRAAQAYESGAYGRPLATMWFGVDHLIGGKDPFVYKVSSVLVHLVNTFLVFLLTRGLLASPTLNWGRPALAAGFIATLWAVHPLQVSSVLYVVQRMETLALTFTLLGLLLYLKARTSPNGLHLDWRLLAASAFVAALGMLSKETAVLFPLFAVVLELTVFRFLGADGRTIKALVRLHTLIIVTGCFLFLLLIAPVHFADTAYAGRDFTLMERMLTQPRVLMLYLTQMVVPLPSLTTFYYDHYEASRALLNPGTTLLSIVGVVLLGTSAAVFAKRLPLYALGIGWFFAAHALTSNVVNLELVFEHRNYFALLGIILALTSLLEAIARRTIDPQTAIAVATVVLIGFGGLGAIRSATWGDPFNLAVDLTSTAPESSRAANDLATLYYGMSDSNPDSPFFQFAMREFDRSRSLPRAGIIPEQGLILMAATAGLDAEAEWWESLTKKVETLPPSPEMYISLHGLLNQYNRGLKLNSEKLDRAVRIFFSKSGSRPEMHYAYGLFILRTSDAVDPLLTHFRDAFAKRHVSESDILSFATLYAGEGYDEAALRLLRELDGWALAHKNH